MKLEQFNVIVSSESGIYDGEPWTQGIYKITSEVDLTKRQMTIARQLKYTVNETTQKLQISFKVIAFDIEVIKRNFELDCKVKMDRITEVEKFANMMRLAENVIKEDDST